MRRPLTSIGIMLLALATSQLWTLATLDKPSPPASGAPPLQHSVETQRHDPLVDPANDLVAVWLSEPAVSPGGKLQLSGATFGPNESVILRTAPLPEGESRELARLRADGAGRLADVELTMPDSLRRGLHSLEATGASSQRKARTVISIRADEPWIEIEASHAERDRFGVIAGGFEPGETVVVYLVRHQHDELPPIPLTVLAADLGGNIGHAEVILPALLDPGEYSLVLKGRHSGTQQTHHLQWPLLGRSLD